MEILKVSVYNAIIRENNKNIPQRILIYCIVVIEQNILFFLQVT